MSGITVTAHWVLWRSRGGSPRTPGAVWASLPGEGKIGVPLCCGQDLFLQVSTAKALPDVFRSKARGACVPQDGPLLGGVTGPFQSTTHLMCLSHLETGGSEKPQSRTEIGALSDPNSFV